MKRIDINDWVLSGGGARGVSYFHKTNPDIMLKFDNGDVPVEVMEHEIAVSRQAYNLGIPSPEPGEVVTDGERFGTIYTRIRNKVSFARELADHPEKVDELARTYAEMVKSLHNTVCTDKDVRDVKEVYREAILDNPVEKEEIKKKALKLLESLPDGNSCLHGDLHFGNVILADGKTFFIDMGNFAQGDPLFDLSMIFCVDRMAATEPENFMNNYHCKPEISHRFLNVFIKSYFGENSETEDIFKLLRPYIALRVLTMETEVGRAVPDSAKDYVFDIFDEI